MNANVSKRMRVAVAAVIAIAVYGAATVAQQPDRQPTRIVEGQPGGEIAQPENRQPTRQVPPRGQGGAEDRAGRGGTYGAPRDMVRIAPRRIAPRPGGRWFLGVTIDDGPLGLRVSNVSRLSPAERAGLESGDYILDVMGYPVGVFGGYYWPLDYTLEYVTPPDGWVNVLVWNKRTLAEEAMWVRLEPRGGIRPLDYPARGGVMPPPGVPRSSEQPPGTPRNVEPPLGFPRGGEK